MRYKVVAVGVAIATIAGVALFAQFGPSPRPRPSAGWWHTCRCEPISPTTRPLPGP